jgi:hypothetical protein
MSPYQERIAGMLERGYRLEQRMRRTGFGFCWDHQVTVLVAPDGGEVETVNARTVAVLAAAGLVGPSSIGSEVS